MKLERLNKEEKLNLIFTTLKNNIIKKTEKDYRVEVMYYYLIDGKLRNDFNNTINLEKISYVYIIGSDLTLSPETGNYHQKVEIEMSTKDSNKVIYLLSLFYEPNVELISEILTNYRSTSVVKE